MIRLFFFGYNPCYWQNLGPELLRGEPGLMWPKLGCRVDAALSELPQNGTPQGLQPVVRVQLLRGAERLTRRVSPSMARRNLGGFSDRPFAHASNPKSCAQT